MFLVALLVLFILPLFKTGIYNDLAMRGSIPALFIFWSLVAKVIWSASIRVRKKSKVLYWLVVLIVIIGFVSAIFEFAHSAQNYQLKPPDFAAIPLASEATERQWVMLRVGNQDSLFFRCVSK